MEFIERTGNVEISLFSLPNFIEKINCCFFPILVHTFSNL